MFCSEGDPPCATALNHVAFKGFLPPDYISCCIFFFKDCFLGEILGRGECIGLRTLQGNFPRAPRPGSAGGNGPLKSEKVGLLRARAAQSGL